MDADTVTLGIGGAFSGAMRRTIRFVPTTMIKPMID